jgi:hypothetical protein
MSVAENIDIENPVRYCIDIMLKEARKEDRLVRQLFYAMASAYTNNPINLAINSPSGEGKNWVIRHVAEKFPNDDVIRLSGMTVKSIFHRRGLLVVKNQETGEYEPLEDKLSEIDHEISEKKQEMLRTQSSDTKNGLESFIGSLEHDKREVKARSKKLIDLSHKIIIFMDTPPPELLNALMSLLSHDEHVTEYEYVDVYNGIGTKTNVLRGWPVFIFAQATDLGHYRRYTEIQRRFIFASPRMDSTKYEAAIDLIVDSIGIPDFMYQAKVLGKDDFDKCKELILQIRSRMLEMANRVRPDKNQRVFVPFPDAIKSSVPKTKGFDMTTSSRLMSFLSLLTLVNVDRRPRLVTLKTKDGEESGLRANVDITPLALFEDLGESISVMENSTGLRPYQLEWYEKVFLAEYNSMEHPDSREVRGRWVAEKIKAVTTERLVRKTKEVHNRHITSKKVLETYLEPLLNEGYIDKTGSDLDGRAHIYYPLIGTTKPFDYSINDQSNNISYKPKIVVRNPAIYPDKQYIISKIEEVERYSTEQGLQTTIKNHDWKDMSAEELADKYYGTPEEYFDCEYTRIEEPEPTQKSPVNIYYPQQILRKSISCSTSIIEYFQNRSDEEKSQLNYDNGAESTISHSKTHEILFEEPHTEQSNIFDDGSIGHDDSQSKDLTPDPGPYKYLIIEEPSSEIGTYYRCKEHRNPGDPWYPTLSGLIISHLQPFHSKEIKNEG